MVSDAALTLWPLNKIKEETHVRQLIAKTVTHLIDTTPIHLAWYRAELLDVLDDTTRRIATAHDDRLPTAYLNSLIGHSIGTALNRASARIYRAWHHANLTWHARCDTRSDTTATEGATP